MALNVKAAMLICVGFVGSMSWLLQGLAPRERLLRSPLAVRSEAELAGVYGDRPAWMNRLAQSSAVDAARAVAPGAGADGGLAWAERDARGSPGVLPPLVQTLADPLETVVAAMREEYVSEPTSAAAGPVLTAQSEGPAGPGPVRAGEPAGLPMAGPVLAGQSEGLPAAAAVRASAALAPAVPTMYRVAKGDSLARIARRELNSADPRVVQLLLDLNPQVRSRRGQQVRVGEALTLPDADAVRQAQRGAAPARQTEAWEWYTIQPRDSLASIARQQLKDARRWREILALNSGLDPRRIVPGTKIRLPAAVRVVSR